MPYKNKYCGFLCVCVSKRMCVYACFTHEAMGRNLGYQPSWTKKDELIIQFENMFK